MSSTRCNFCGRLIGNKEQIKQIQIAYGDNQKVCQLCYKKLNKYAKKINPVVDKIINRGMKK